MNKTCEGCVWIIPPAGIIEFFQCVKYHYTHIGKRVDPKKTKHPFPKRLNVCIENELRLLATANECREIIKREKKKMLRAKMKAKK